MIAFMTTQTRPPTLLDHVYDELELGAGTLLDASPAPDSAPATQKWRDLGDWLLLAARVEAERIFFVNNDPVLVFASLPANPAEEEILDFYRRTWSLGRPRCLFLMCGTELRVYSLTKLPPTPGQDSSPLEALEIVTSASHISEKLADFHRAGLELGSDPKGRIFDNDDGRADHQLIRDVQAATLELANAGLPHRIAHSLIERAILIRYLEDRRIVTPDYIETIPAPFPSSTTEQSSPGDPPQFGPDSRFIGLLRSKDLTFALFDKLARDFNGDLFLASAAERAAVTTEHLRLLSSMLYGRPTSGQQPLFLWAYDFSVVPTSLISTMYELFYHQDTGNAQEDTYYTPSALVEFILADVLTDSVLDRNPRICDPACGSGVFLVEAYRRIVRHETLRTGTPLSADDLKHLLLTRIAGSDINQAAIQLAAFSLYIAFLNYQTPQDIQQAGPLPKLIHRRNDEDVIAPLVVSDAFAPLRDDPIPPGERASELGGQLPWTSGEFDVVVGNPPWTEIKGERIPGEVWAERKDYAIGQRSPSQLFLWRSLHLLSDSGVAALLVGANAMLNAGPKSKAFRRQWLARVRLEHVVNFSQVRASFFRQGVAPFMLVKFRHADHRPTSHVIYENARQVPKATLARPTIARLERQVVSQDSLQARDYLWKTYAAGSLRDDALMARLSLDTPLRDWSGSLRAYGYQRPHGAAGDLPSESLSKMVSLSRFDSWGQLQDARFEKVPPRVTREPDERLYSGRRLLIRQGISPRFGPHARLETASFAFRHTTYALSVEHLHPWQSAVILGTLLSQLGRYWLYMVSGAWGMWRDTVRLDDLLNLPVRIKSESDRSTQRLVAAIHELQHVSVTNTRPPRQGSPIPLEVRPVMRQIDNDVADLFELTGGERDLVADFWLAQEQDATAPIPNPLPSRGTMSDAQSLGLGGIGPYLQVFLKVWNRRLGGTGEFAWTIWRDHQSNVVAAVFETQAFGKTTGPSNEAGTQEEWTSALRTLGVHWTTSESQSILRYGLVRAVSDTAIVIVKRDERRLWTATAARQDADATAAQVMSLERR